MLCVSLTLCQVDSLFHVLGAVMELWLSRGVCTMSIGDRRGWTTASFTLPRANSVVVLQIKRVETAIERVEADVVRA